MWIPEITPMPMKCPYCDCPGVTDEPHSPWEAFSHTWVCVNCKSVLGGSRYTPEAKVIFASQTAPPAALPKPMHNIAASIGDLSNQYDRIDYEIAQLEATLSRLREDTAKLLQTYHAISDQLTHSEENNNS